MFSHFLEKGVVPTLVGVVRIGLVAGEVCFRCPHARGGGPASQTDETIENPRCPHARGGGPLGIVRKPGDGGSCPHARGGGPWHNSFARSACSSCPHARGGGPHGAHPGTTDFKVVPTLVGVVRQRGPIVP